MDLHSIISYHPHPQFYLCMKRCLIFCSPLCHDLVVTSVSVFLPPTLPGAVLVKALNASGLHIGGLMEGRSGGLLSGGMQ